MSLAEIEAYTSYGKVREILQLLFVVGMIILGLGGIALIISGGHAYTDHSRQDQALGHLATGLAILFSMIPYYVAYMTSRVLFDIADRIMLTNLRLDKLTNDQS